MRKLKKIRRTKQLNLKITKKHLTVKAQLKWKKKKKNKPIKKIHSKLTHWESQPNNLKKKKLRATTKTNFKNQ